MGGHGALTLGLRNPQIYRSISAFAPISNPSNCPWGQKALGNYLGSGRSAWRQYDATEIIRDLAEPPAGRILVDQGLADQFLEQELNIDRLETVCREKGVDLELRRHEGYDHGYYFIASFIADHLRHHAAMLTF